MALPVRFSLINSIYNDFLYSPIGEEQSGITLSVMSALVRLELDPWHEAGRLATLPEAAAVDNFAETITQVSPDRWKRPEALAIAKRLIRLLPTPQRSFTALKAPGRPRWAARDYAILAACLALLLTAIVAVGRSSPPNPDARDPAASDQHRS
jgi:hypothetical protein